MQSIYKPLAQRVPDTQYRDRLAAILDRGDMIKDTPQGIGALTCFATLPPMVFDLSNGVPLITERSCSAFWKKAVAEIIAFINGARMIGDIHSFGTDFWEAYRGKGTKLGLKPDDMGPGSYGAAFTDFPAETADGRRYGLNQFEQLLQQLKDFPQMRTHLVTPWVPYYTARGPARKVIVAPCHGWLHFRLINGRLDMRMDQRSADVPIGVPSNMIQYAALLLMVCGVTGHKPGRYIHSFGDAHVYENQIDKVRDLVTREPRPFPRLFLKPRSNLFDFRIEDFELDEYDPHPGMRIPFAP